MKCLLVDDEPGIREGLAAWLRRHGLDVRTAASCAAARAALADEFDVVVTDWRLPDGLAASFLHGVTTPVLAVSGYPEEVARLPAVRAVLTKPTPPARLLAAIHGVLPAPARAPADTLAQLPEDVRAAIAAFADHVGCAAVELADDGTFVVATATVAAGADARTASPHGDLRVSTLGDRSRVELRLRRDGWPAADLPIVRAGEPWPDHGELGVDFHGTTIAAAAFEELLARTAAAAAAGRRVQWLNVPPSLRSYAAGQGRAHDMPMRDAVGPRLPAELADLWSDP